MINTKARNRTQVKSGDIVRGVVGKDRKIISRDKTGKIVLLKSDVKAGFIKLSEVKDNRTYYTCKGRNVIHYKKDMSLDLFLESFRGVGFNVGFNIPKQDKDGSDSEERLILLYNLRDRALVLVTTIKNGSKCFDAELIFDCDEKDVVISNYELNYLCGYLYKCFRIDIGDFYQRKVVEVRNNYNNPRIKNTAISWKNSLPMFTSSDYTYYQLVFCKDEVLKLFEGNPIIEKLIILRNEVINENEGDFKGITDYNNQCVELDYNTYMRFRQKFLDKVFTSGEICIKGGYK